MASKKLKGITIEIDGSTTKLNDALKSTNKAIYSTNSELRELNKALKLDPKNTELLSQKQELLKKSISESTNRLNALKEAQRQMGDYNSLTEEQKENYRELAREIAKSENAINGMNKELKNTGSIDLSKVGNTLKKVGNVKGGDFNSLYNQVIGELESNFLYKNLINENDYNMCSYMINKIFNFYINGFPNIPID